MGIEMSLPGPIFKLQSTLLNDDKENGKKKVEEERGWWLEKVLSIRRRRHKKRIFRVLWRQKNFMSTIFCPSLGFVAERSVALVKQSDLGLNTDWENSFFPNQKKKNFVHSVKISI